MVGTVLRTASFRKSLQFDNLVCDGEWSTEAKDVIDEEGPCNIERHQISELSQEEFLLRLGLFSVNLPTKYTAKCFPADRIELSRISITGSASALPLQYPPPLHIDNPCVYTI